MWKTLPVSSLNFFCCCCCSGGRGVGFFSSSPSTSFLLWNVSNGQRLTSDWLNSKTISFVLLFLFENSYQFAQGKKWQAHLSHTLGFQAGKAQTLWNLLGISGKKGERQKYLSLGFEGGRLLPHHSFGVTLSPGRLCSHPWLDYKCLQRRE